MRPLALALAAAALFPAAARADGLELVANHPAALGATEVEMAGDLAFLVGGGGLEIISVKDPKRPKTLSTLECGGTFDVALDPAAQIAVLAIDGTSTCMEGEGFVVLDVRDPADPDKLSSVQMPLGAHTVTMDGRTLYANHPDETLQVRRMEVFDLTDPADPRPLSTISFTGHGAHDSYVRHRPDGRTLLYTANVSAAHVFDVTDPSKPVELEQVRDPAVNYAHAAEVSHDDRVIMVSDEMLIGAPSGVCGKAPAGADIGALHFYGADPDGTFAAGAPKLGSWNVPLQPSGDETCTIHVFVQSPDSRRVVAAWYKQGTRIADFTDPAAVKELASYVPAPSRARQSIPHNGLVFTADIDRGLDVLRFTGEGWPATAGPAEAFRFGRAAAKAPATVPPATPAASPAPPAAANPAGRVCFTVRGRGALDLHDARGVQVATLRIARRARTRVCATALPGRYRWALRTAKRRVLRSGRITVRRATPGMALPPGVVARLRTS